MAGDGGPNDRAEKSKDKAKADDKPAIMAAATKPEIELVDPSELMLGSRTDKSLAGYLIEAQLEQKGAGIESVVLVAVRRRAWQRLQSMEAEEASSAPIDRARPALASLAGIDLESRQSGPGRCLTRPLATEPMPTKSRLFGGPHRGRRTVGFGTLGGRPR